jgi:N-acetylmuramoyl-L-alanine amidase
MSFQPDSLLVDDVRPSPNHGERVGGPADALVLHYTGMPRCADAIARLCDPEAQVSAHYVIEESGRLWQLVPERRRAWHAGRSRWGEETDLNSRSIGIEICNPGHDGGAPPYPRRQIARVIDLVADVLARNAISPARVLAHSDIAPDRKDDPGERFPWGALARRGLCLWARPEPIRPADGALDAAGLEELRKGLAALGYPASASGWSQMDVLALKAFQRRWRRARVDGAPDRSSLATLRRAMRAARIAADSM